jgi:pentapeptide MXKDX repeat protein
MRSYLRLTTLAATLLVTAWSLPGCSSSDEGSTPKVDSGAMPSKDKMGGGAMDKDKMGGGDMDKDKMGGGAMDKDKMGGGAMDKGKMDTPSKN